MVMVLKYVCYHFVLSATFINDQAWTQKGIEIIIITFV